MANLVYSAEEKAILESGQCNYVGLVKIEMPEPVRLSTAVGDIPVFNSAFDANGTIYQGGARLISLPTFQRIANAIAERVTYVLSGVTDEMKALATTYADDLKGSVIRMGVMILNEEFGQVGPVRWLRRGRADMITTENKAEGGQRFRSIEISAGSYFTGRKVPAQGTFTNADHQARAGNSTDRFCERTPLYNRDTLLRWPP